VQARERPARVVQRLAYAAQPIAAVPRPHQPLQLHQALGAVDVVHRCAAGRRLKHLAQWSGQVLREARGRAVGGLGDEHPVAVVGVAALRCQWLPCTCGLSASEMEMLVPSPCRLPVWLFEPLHVAEMS
jgi:hypothetical protein